MSGIKFTVIDDRLAESIHTSIPGLYRKLKNQNGKEKAINIMKQYGVSVKDTTFSYN